MTKNTLKMYKILPKTESFSSGTVNTLKISIASSILNTQQLMPSEVPHIIISKVEAIFFIKTEQISKTAVPSSVKWNKLKGKIGLELDQIFWCTQKKKH